MVCTYIVLSVGLLGCPVRSGTSEPTADDKCSDTDLAIKQVWNEETRVNIKGKVLKWGGQIGIEVAKATAEETINKMDRLVDDWARMRKATCRDHFVRNTIDESGYQSRVDCLNKILIRQRNLLNTLDAVQVNVAEQLAAIGDELNSCVVQ